MTIYFSKQTSDTILSMGRSGDSSSGTLLLIPGMTFFRLFLSEIGWAHSHWKKVIQVQ